MLGWIINAVAFLMFPLCRPSPYPVLSMYNLRLNCSVSSAMLSTIIGIPAVALLALAEKVAMYRPGVKSNPAKKLKSYF